MTIYEKIEAAKRTLNALPLLTDGSLERLDEEFVYSNTYNSNAIEGSTLTERETYMVLKEGAAVPGKPLRHQIEAIGHKKAYEYLRQLASRGAPVSEGLIKDVHRLVLMDRPDEGGRYREVDVHIAGSDALLTGAEAVPAAMKGLIARYNAMNEGSRLVDRIAVFHLEFERIHPFIDGNGRTGRLLLNYELMAGGYPPIDIKNQDKGRYYYCFSAYQGADETDLPMKQLIGEYVLGALHGRIAIMEKARRIREERSG